MNAWIFFYYKLYFKTLFCYGLSSTACMSILSVDANVVSPCLLVKACTARNCYPSPLNYYNFPKSCCTSVNEVICHGIPDRRLLQEGDILNSMYQHACAHIVYACILLARFHGKSYFCLQECCFLNYISVSPDVS